MTPASSHTGVGTACVVLDTLDITFRGDVPVRQVLELFGEPGQFIHQGRGANGYRGSLRRGEIQVLIDGSEAMGTHVRLNSGALRQLECEGIIVDPVTFLRMLEDWSARVTRIDIAADDVGGALSFPEIVKSVRERSYTSRLRHWELLESGGNGKPDSEITVYVGSKLSQVRVRIYNKIRDPERNIRRVRVELQLRDGQARSMVSALIEHGAAAAIRLLDDQLRFRDSGSHSQRERWPIADWWRSFLGACTRLRLTTEATVRSVARSIAWLRNQVAPTLAFVAQASGNPEEFVRELLNLGKERLKPWHRRLLE